MKVIKTDEGLKKVFDRVTAMDTAARAMVEVILEKQAKIVMDNRETWREVRRLAAEQYPDENPDNLTYDHTIREFLIKEVR